MTDSSVIKENQCPYSYWSLYFNNEVYDYKHKHVSIIEEFTKYAQNIGLQVEKQSLSSELLHQLKTSPRPTLDCAAMALCELLFEPDSVNYKLRVRLINYGQMTTFKELSANIIGHLVSVRGVVTSVHCPRTYSTSVNVTCAICNEKQTVQLTSGGSPSVTSCKTSFCKNKGTPSSLKFESHVDLTDCQTIQIQEIFTCESLMVPQMIECELRHELVNIVNPGDAVYVTGIVEVNSQKGSYNNRHVKKHTLYIDVVSINKISNSEEIDQEYAPFIAEDLCLIHDIVGVSNVFKVLVNSFCTDVFGQEIIKAGLLLSLFAGDHSIHYNEHNVLHVLIVGDPGTPAAQLISTTTMLSNMTVVSRQTTPAENRKLTPRLSRENLSNNWILEAGPLVACDRGTCRVEDLSTFQDLDALAEALDKQSVLVYETGIACKLLCRTSLLATANPTKGHYDKSKTIAENTKLKNNLLSHFDLVFLILDKPEESSDRHYSELIMKARSRGEFGSSSQYQGFRNASTKAVTHATDVKSRLRVSQDEGFTPVPLNLLKEYITYAVTASLREKTKSVYENMRRKYRSFVDETITLKQLETLLKLSIARARVELRDTVTQEDVEDVAEIIEYCLLQVQRDDIRQRNESGRRLNSRQAEARRLLSHLQGIASANQSDTFTLDELSQISTTLNLQYDNFQAFVDFLNEQGLVLKKAPGIYQIR
ncbi:6160_t:CDS:10 [Paraglomus occultum]|uniref:6160_t:CDS:1 n=1 Tax=Paraglomus occultum TaxID=144539 RepID=A0A9N9ARQ2_9GLOM|nr:6160_t:CDS:10 [Paraglomus occultum]